jgi:hypothetical protein
VKLSSWPEIGLDGDALLTPYVPKGITGYDDDDDDDSSYPFLLRKVFCYNHFSFFGLSVLLIFLDEVINPHAQP